MLDPRLFALRGFSAGSLSITVQFFAAFGFFFAALQYLQFVVGLSPLQAALRLLPLPLVMVPLARNAPRLARRIGTELTVLVDEVDGRRVTARSQADAPEIDGLVRVDGAIGAKVGDFLRVRVTGADTHDLSAIRLA